CHAYVLVAGVLPPKRARPAGTHERWVEEVPFPDAWFPLPQWRAAGFAQAVLSKYFATEPPTAARLPPEVDALFPYELDLPRSERLQRLFWPPRLRCASPVAPRPDAGTGRLRCSRQRVLLPPAEYQSLLWR